MASVLKYVKFLTKNFGRDLKKSDCYCINEIC